MLSANLDIWLCKDGQVNLACIFSTHMTKRAVSEYLGRWVVKDGGMHMGTPILMLGEVRVYKAELRLPKNHFGR